MSAQLPPPLQAPGQPPARQTSALAVVSLISGLLSWLALPLVGSVVAIVCGHMARSEIRKQPQQLEGDTMAVIGLVLGWLQIGFVVLALLVIFLFLGGLAWFGFSRY
ncbi:DUF4190 domain-containing protein [Luteimonas sp. e5]